MAVSDQTYLDNIDTALNAIITGQVASLTADQRSLTRLSIRELMDLKEKFEARVQAGTSTSDAGGMIAVVQRGER